jgi:hypothetical protein
MKYVLNFVTSVTVRSTSVASGSRPKLKEESLDTVVHEL